MKAWLRLFFTWWSGKTLGTLVYTWRYGKRLGQDSFGNVYFEGDKDYQGRKRRWVIYQGSSDPSSIPSGWHAWIHHRSDILPNDDNYSPRAWEKPHQANRTGTSFAYLPQGSLSLGGQRPGTGADYRPWVPDPKS